MTDYFTVVGLLFSGLHSIKVLSTPLHTRCCKIDAVLRVLGLTEPCIFIHYKQCCDLFLVKIVQFHLFPLLKQILAI